MSDQLDNSERTIGRFYFSFLLGVSWARFADSASARPQHVCPLGDRFFAILAVPITSDGGLRGRIGEGEGSSSSHRVVPTDQARARSGGGVEDFRSRKCHGAGWSIFEKSGGAVNGGRCNLMESRQQGTEKRPRHQSKPSNNPYPSRLQARGVKQTARGKIVATSPGDSRVRSSSHTETRVPDARAMSIDEKRPLGLVAQGQSVRPSVIKAPSFEENIC